VGNIRGFTQPPLLSDTVDGPGVFTPFLIVRNSGYWPVKTRPRLGVELENPTKPLWHNIIGGQKCMSFCATELSPKKNLHIRNKTYKARTTTTTSLWTSGAESLHAQTKSLLELTASVKIESLAKLLVIYTTALSQLTVAAG